MRLALSEISTVNASFADDVAAYAAAGFDAIGLFLGSGCFCEGQSKYQNEHSAVNHFSDSLRSVH